MAIDFPASPTVGQTFTSGGRTWVYSSGGTWDVPSSSTLPFDLTIGGSFTATNYDVAGKNKIINGGFDIWQRGNSLSNTGVSAFIADRWNFYRGAYAAGMTMSRWTSGLDGFQYCARIQRDSGNTATNGLYLAYNFETNDSYQFAGKQVTLSFYARAGANFSATSSIVTANIASGTGVDQVLRGTVTGYTNINGVNATLLPSGSGGINNTGWQRFSVTATVSSTATQLFVSIGYIPVGTAGTNDYFEVTGVQLERGSVATPFSRAGGTIQGELAACQRYYETGKAWGFVTKYSDAGTRGSNAIFKVSKRATPTMSVGSYATLATSTTEWYGYVVSVLSGNESILTWTAEAEL